MVLQSVIFPNTTCSHSNLYYRNAELLLEDQEPAVVLAGNNISFFSYMNCIDLDMWNQYTHIRYVLLRMDVRGKGRIYVKCKVGDKVENISYLDFDEENIYAYKGVKIEIDIANLKGLCFFEIESISNVTIHNPRFETNQNSTNKYVHLALNICTFHRNNDIVRNLKQLKDSKFYDEESDFYDRLSIVVVDNGTELEIKKERNYMLVHNVNNGGSGGFKRGLQELRKWKEDITHVIFMDDDVAFLNESFYRLFALLSYMKDEYAYESVAGRMFRLDERHIQYTAAEIWNKGDIEHIGLNQDMTKEANLSFLNNNSCAEYGGWWFCCYPMAFAKENDPLPFFIHCDDVEYGLRHRGTPIILNGIQVWHETYEYRQTPIMKYYDTRNSLLVNEIYSLITDRKKILEEWKREITKYHNERDYLTEQMIILGMLDYLKGMNWLQELDAVKHNIHLQKKNGHKLINAFLWRYTKKRYEKKFISNELVMH